MPSEPDRSRERVNRYVDENEGAGRSVVDHAAEGEGEARLPPEVGDADMSAVGCWFDDEPPIVTVTVGVGAAEVQLRLEPEEAQRFAADLRTAATDAIQGDAELTE